MRIVAGRFKGRALAGPRSDAIRPTSDRLRETLFNVLQHAYDDPVSEARVLDLFAGTGALGLEAVSRGASFALFVEDAADARGVIRANVDTFGLTGSTRIYRRDATKLGPIGPMRPFTLAFCDPPYGKGLGERALAAAHQGGWLVTGSLVILEESIETELTLPIGFAEIETRPQGDSKLVFLKVEGSTTSNDG